MTKVTIALLPVVGTHGCVALIEKCKVARSVHVNSGLVDSFECQHIKEAKNSSECSPIATLYPNLVNYPCSDVVCSELPQIVSSLPSANSPSVIQVSDRSFAVFGSPSASNPLGLCHVQKEARTKSGYTCTGKDCRSYASKAKGIAVKACCLHLHLPFASLRQFPSLDSCTSSESISVLVIAGPSQTPSHTSSSSIAAAEPSCSSSRPTASASSSSSTATIHTPTTSASSCSATMHTNPVSSSIQKQSTVTLAEKCRKLPYQIPRVLLRSIMTRDSCTLFGIEGAWPEFFCPKEENCALCGSSLGPVSNHPG